MFMHYIEDHQDNWDELVSVLALAYNRGPTERRAWLPWTWSPPGA